MEIRDGRYWGCWLLALAGAGVSGCSAEYKEEGRRKGELSAALDASGDRALPDSHGDLEVSGRPQGDPPSGVLLDEIPALATLHFEDGNELAIREFAGGVLVTETGRLGSSPRYRFQQTWADLFRDLAPEVELPPALLKRDQVRSRLTQYHQHEASPRPSPSRIPQLEAVGGDVDEPGEYEQSSGLFPAESFISQACRFPTVPFQYVRTELTAPETQSFRNTYFSYHAVAADRGDVVAHLTSAIPNFEGDVFANVAEGTFSTNAFAADVVQRGNCLDFVFAESCTPNLLFHAQGLVVHGVEQVASTDRYHHCGYMASEPLPFGPRP